MDKQQKQIEEILEKVGTRYGMDVGGISYIVNAHKLTPYLQPKIPENTVLKEKALEKLVSALRAQVEAYKEQVEVLKEFNEVSCEATRKETAEKMMNEISVDDVHGITFYLLSIYQHRLHKWHIL